MLTPSSRTYQGWLNPTVELYQDVYLFNWTNPEELKDKTKKPAFTQLGPYRFREYRNIINVNFHESTVSFQKFSNFFFDPEGSNGTLSDLCTTVNMVIKKILLPILFLAKSISRLVCLLGSCGRRQ